MTAFVRYIVIDYSGAQTPTASLKGLRVYLADCDAAPVEALLPPSPHEYWTRRGIAEWQVERLPEDAPRAGPSRGLRGQASTRPVASLCAAPAAQSCSAVDRRLCSFHYRTWAATPSDGESLTVEQVHGAMLLEPGQGHGLDGLIAEGLPPTALA